MFIGAMTNDPYKEGAAIAKAFWPLVVTVVGLTAAGVMQWSALANRVSTVEASNSSIQDDVKWLRTNTYNLLIKQGVQPINP